MNAFVIPETSEGTLSVKLINVYLRAHHKTLSYVYLQEQRKSASLCFWANMT
jgi:hypothetical protein